MNKLFKLIMVNLLSMFDINKIRIARLDGVKSNLEKKTVITGIIALVYGYFLYQIFLFLNLDNKYLILGTGFIISTLFCFFTNLSIIESTIFKNQDNEMLFSLPVTRQQILFSKLFIIYLRNLLLTGIIMVSSILSYGYFIKELSDTFVMMYILSILIVPLVPIVLSTIIAYVDDYFKLKNDNNVLYKIVKFIIILICLFILFIIFRNIRSGDVNQLIDNIIKKFYFIYPLSYLFMNSLIKESIISFLGLILIPLLIIYIYTLFISNNYLRICSLLKGIEKKSSFKYKKSKNLHKVFGMFRKELLTLFNNKFYLFNSFGGTLLFSILLFIGLSIFDVSWLYEKENIDLYINLYVPTLLCMFVTLKGSAVSSMSLEKDNMQILRTMPVSIGKILLSKWMLNVFIGSIFVLINGSIVWYFLKLSKWGIIYSYLIPFISLLFISLTAIILDYRFIEKNETDDNAIIKQRFLVMVPTFISILIGIGTLFMPVYKQYKFLLGSYALAMILAMFIECIYLRINRSKLIKGLFN